MRALRLAVGPMVIGVVLVLAVGVGLVVVKVIGGGGGSFTTCDPGSGSPSSGDGAAVTVRVGDLDAEQRGNAATILGVVRGMGAPPRAALVALATAMQESGLRNLHYGDRDSQGLFQQRPSQGWGSVGQVTDPVHATTTFLGHLLAIPGWQQLPVTVAAQLVQRSAFPNAYAKWEALAGSLVAALGGIADPVGCTLADATLALPDGVVSAAVGFALNELGKPYVWGATGPGAYDCSGLMLRAFQAAGVILPRVAADQYRAGAHLPVAQARPGDLLFWAYDPGDPATIHHVAMYLGDGRIVEAQQTGVPVHVRPVSFTEPELVPLATRPAAKAG